MKDMSTPLKTNRWVDYLPKQKTFVGSALGSQWCTMISKLSEHSKMESRLEEPGEKKWFSFVKAQIFTNSMPFGITCFVNYRVAIVHKNLGDRLKWCWFAKPSPFNTVHFWMSIRFCEFSGRDRSQNHQFTRCCTLWIHPLFTKSEFETLIVHKIMVLNMFFIYIYMFSIV